jgi:hypothetical protein
MAKSKSKSLIRDKWTTVEIDKDGNVERVLIVSTKVILDPDDKDYNAEKFDRIVDEVKFGLGGCDRAHIFNSDDT